MRPFTSFPQAIVMVFFSILMAWQLSKIGGALQSNQEATELAMFALNFFLWFGVLAAIYYRLYSPVFARAVFIVGFLGAFVQIGSVVLVSMTSIGSGVQFFLHPDLLMGLALSGLTMVCAHWIGSHKSKWEYEDLDLNGNEIK